MRPCRLGLGFTQGRKKNVLVTGQPQITHMLCSIQTPSPAAFLPFLSVTLTLSALSSHNVSRSSAVMQAPSHGVGELTLGLACCIQ